MPLENDLPVHVNRGMKVLPVLRDAKATLHRNVGTLRRLESYRGLALDSCAFRPRRRHRSANGAIDLEPAVTIGGLDGRTDSGGHIHRARSQVASYLPLGHALDVEWGSLHIRIWNWQVWCGHLAGRHNW